MRIPHKCPVCDGRGTVAEGFYNAFGAATNLSREECRACKGTGVLWGDQFVLKPQPVRLPIPVEPLAPIEILPPVRMPGPSRTSDPYPTPPPIMCEMQNG